MRPSRPSTRLAVFAFAALCCVLGVLLRGRLLGYSGRRRLSQQRPNDTTFIVQEDLSFVTVTLEKSPQLPLHQLSIIGKPQAPTDADVEKAFAVIRSILDRNLPLTIHYDLREAVSLTRKQISMGIAWAQERPNAHALDVNLQCIIFTMNPGIVRALAKLVIRLMGPPQPVHIGDDELSAIKFAQTRCKEKKDWSAESAARDVSRGRDSAQLELAPSTPAEAPPPHTSEPSEGLYHDVLESANSAWDVLAGMLAFGD